MKLVIILLFTIFSSTALAHDIPTALKCDLIQINNMDTSDRKLLASNSADYLDNGSGGVVADMTLRSMRLAIDIFSGTDENNQKLFFRSMLVRERGLMKASSKSRDAVAPAYFAMEYRPRFHTHQFSAMYLIECSNQPCEQAQIPLTDPGIANRH